MTATANGFRILIFPKGSLIEKTTNNPNMFSIFFHMHFITPEYIFLYRLTVVQDFATYWVDCNSIDLPVRQAPADAATSSSTSSSSTTTAAPVQARTQPPTLPPTLPPTQPPTTRRPTTVYVPPTTRRPTTVYVPPTTRRQTTVYVPPPTTRRVAVQSTTRKIVTYPAPSNTGQDSYLDYAGKANLKHKTMSTTECMEYGNFYRIKPNTDCREYIQSTQSGAPGYPVKCPGSTKFDPRACTCAFTLLCPFP